MNVSTCTKKKYGATFHKHMALSDMIHTWVTKVPEDIKQQYPVIDAMFTNAAAISQAQVTAVQARITATEAYNIVQLAVETASAVITSNVTQPATLSTATTAKVASMVQVQIIDTQKEAVLNTLC
jgi:hypothetical protein